MCDGKRTISKTTLSSGWAFFAPGSPTEIGLAEHRAVDLHHAQAGRLEIRADELMRFALEHLDDHAARIAKAAAASFDRPHQHRVAAGGIERVFGRDVDVLLAHVRRAGARRAHEAETAGRAAKYARDAI